MREHECRKGTAVLYQGVVNPTLSYRRGLGGDLHADVVIGSCLLVRS